MPTVWPPLSPRPPIWQLVQCKQCSLRQRRASARRANFNSVSFTLIPYPLPTYLKSLHDKHESGGHEFPLHLVPPYSATQKCKRGHQFNSADPVENHWLSRKGAVIHKEAVTIEDEDRTIFYWPSLGSCDCKQAYDGQKDLLFNLDGRHLF